VPPTVTVIVVSPGRAPAGIESAMPPALTVPPDAPTVCVTVCVAVCCASEPPLSGDAVTPPPPSSDEGEPEFVEEHAIKEAPARSAQLRRLIIESSPVARGAPEASDGGQRRVNLPKMTERRWGDVRRDATGPRSRHSR
jgi:hypothetical protein